MTSGWSLVHDFRRSTSSIGSFRQRGAFLHKAWMALFFFSRLLDGVVREKQARWPFWFERISLPWRYCSCPWLIISLRCRYRSSCGMWCDKALEKCQLLTSPSPRPMWASANRNRIKLGIRSIQHSTSSFAVFFSHRRENLRPHDRAACGLSRVTSQDHIPFDGPN